MLVTEIRKNIVKDRLIGMFKEKTFEEFYDEFPMIQSFVFFGSYVMEKESFESDLDILVHSSSQWILKHTEEEQKELLLQIHSFLSKKLNEELHFLFLDIKLHTGIYGDYSGYTYRNDKKEPIRYYFHQGIRGLREAITVENDFLILNNW